MERRGGTQTRLPEGDLSYDSAFVQLYQSYYTKVFAFVYSRVGNVELTKDLAAGPHWKRRPGHTEWRWP